MRYFIYILVLIITFIPRLNAKIITKEQIYQIIAQFEKLDKGKISFEKLKIKSTDSERRCLTKLIFVELFLKYLSKQNNITMNRKCSKFYSKNCAKLSSKYPSNSYFIVKNALNNYDFEKKLTLLISFIQESPKAPYITFAIYKALSNFRKNLFFLQTSSVSMEEYNRSFDIAKKILGDSSRGGMYDIEAFKLLENYWCSLLDKNYISRTKSNVQLEKIDSAKKEMSSKNKDLALKLWSRIVKSL